MRNPMKRENVVKGSVSLRNKIGIICLSVSWFSL